MPRPAWTADRELELVARHLWGHAAVGDHFVLLPGEETLTDVASLSLKRRRFGFTRFRGRLPDARRVHVHKFTLPQEAVTGADLNILLISNGFRRSIRVQAKRLYPSGAYTPAKTTQTSNLLAVSASQRARAMFGFYNGPQAGNVNSACLLNDPTRLGCTLVPALLGRPPTGVKKQPWTNAGIGSNGIPLSCLVRCYCFGGGGTHPDPGGKYPKDQDRSQPRPPLPSVDAVLKAVAGAIDAAAEWTAEQKDAAKDEFAEATLEEGPLEQAVRVWLATGETGTLDEAARDLFPGCTYLVAVVDDDVNL